jgi:hypothetical protein
MAGKRWHYRVRQLSKALGEARAPVPWEFIRAHLGPEGQRLFCSMSRRDQVHSARAAVLLEAHCFCPGLVVSALLHDVGKGRQSVWQRVLYVILSGYAQGFLGRIARPGPGTRGALYRSLWHPALGARLASEAGYPPEVCRLIVEHHRSGDEPLLRSLQWADDVA